jgi:uncharacterized protein YcfJ
VAGALSKRDSGVARRNATNKEHAMRRLTTVLGTAAAALVMLATPILAQAQDYRYYRHHHHYRHGCHAARRRDANTGTVLGAVIGGVAGNAVGHHSVGGTLVGAGVGAVAGHQIAKNNHPC